jgi:hypothetical protein
MKITPLIFLITWISFISLSQVPAQDNHSVNTFPFHMEFRWIVFEGLMNGVQTDFVFDTGASLGMANSLSESKGRIITTGKRMKILDVNNEIKNVDLGKSEIIQIGTFQFKNVISLINDMDLMYCKDTYLLGSDIISQLNWEIDFEKKVIKVSKKPFPIQDTDLVFKVGYLDQRPFTSLQIVGIDHERLTLIDFGYTGVLDIPRDNKNIQNFLTEKEKKGLSNSFIRYASGALGSSSFPSTTIWVDSIRLGQTYLPRIPVDFEEKTKTKIGLEFFKTISSKIVINNSKSTYALQIRERPEFEKSNGIAVSFEDGKFFLKGKPKGLTPQDSHIAIDEEILSINGLKAADFENNCQFLDWYISLRPLDIHIIRLDGTQLIFPKLALN